MGRLTTRQERFVETYAACGCGATAARTAGYSEKTAKEIASQNLTKPLIRAAIAARKAKFRAVLEITRGDVVGGILAAINVAREKGDAGAQVRGWVEIARLVGLYDQPAEKPVMSANGAALLAKFAGMTDNELLSMARGAG